MSYQLHSDQELVALYQNGSENAFAELLKRHGSVLFGRIMYLVKDEALAADCYQETLFKVVKTLKTGSYNEEGKFHAWAYRIARNLVYDHFRHQKTVRFVRSHDDYDIFEHLDLRDPGAEEAAERDLALNEMQHMLSKLPPEQREVVVLRTYFDLSFKEIAERCDININTALGRMRYAIIRLKKIAEAQEQALEFKLK